MAYNGINAHYMKHGVELNKTLNEQFFLNEK